MTGINWNRNQPIIHHIREVLPVVFPVLATPGHGLHRTGVGGFVRRNIRGTNRISDHAEGRAADIYLDASIDIELKIGDALFYMFINHADDLGVDYVIWNSQIWSLDNPDIRANPARPHTDHVHVSFTRVGSQSRPPRLAEYAEQAKMSILQGIRARIATGG